uniref:Cyclin-like domain-containing protein n=1 Tax=Ditylenchus dipsaci TaxID=166011 RepID=A0A915CN42_9BILA
MLSRWWYPRANVQVMMFQERGGGHEVVGQFVSQYNTLVGGPGNNRSESREITYYKGKKLIQEIASQLRINQHCIEIAFNFFKMCVSRNFTRGRVRSQVVVACLYMTCRLENTTHLLLDFSDVTQINIFDLGRTLNFLTRSLRINLPTTDPCLYVLRFAVMLDFADKQKEVVSLATRIVQRMKRDWMSTGRRPTGLCGAALLLAAKAYNLNRTIADIVRVVHISESVVRRRLDEFANTPSGGLTIEEFSTVDLEENEDPPAFQESKRKTRECQKRRDEDAKADYATKELETVQREIEEALKQKFKSSSYAKLIVTPIKDRAVPELTEADRHLRSELIDTVYNVAVTDGQPSTSDPNPYGPSLASLGIKKPGIELNYYIENNHYAENGDLDLSGIDDDEIDSYILNDVESTIKTKVWLERNGEHLIEAERRRKLREDEEEKCKDAPKKKRKAIRKKDPIQASTHSEAIYQVIQEKKLSSKINWDILGKIDGQSLGDNGPNSESQNKQSAKADIIINRVSDICRSNHKNKVSGLQFLCTFAASILQSISPLLDLQKSSLLPTAYFDETSGAWQNEKESSKVQVYKLAAAVAGSHDTNQKFGMAVLDTGNGLSVIWKFTGLNSSELTRLNINQPKAHSGQQPEIQYSNLYGFFHAQFKYTSDSVCTKLLILNPDQLVAFSVVDGISPSKISELCLNAPDTSLKFMLFEWPSEFAAVLPQNFPLELQCGDCSLEGSLLRLCPTIDSNNNFTEASHRLHDSNVNSTMKEHKSQSSSSWEFCTDKSYSTAATVSEKQNPAYTSQCILSISPKTFDLAHLDDNIEIKITLNDNVNLDLNTSPPSCWLTPATGAANLDMKVLIDEEVIHLSTPKANFAIDTELAVHCSPITNTNKQDLLPVNTTVLVADFKKYVEYYAPSPTTFYVDDLQKTLTVVFSLSLPPQFDYAPNCVVDSNDKSIWLGCQAETPLVISCDLSAHTLNVGYHSVWMIRSPDLWNVTLQSQTPLSISIEQRPSTSIINSAAPALVTTAATATTATSTTVTVRPVAFSPPSFIPQSIKFADSLDSLIIQYNMPLGMSTKGNCSIAIVDLSHFGVRPNCTMNSDQYISVLLGPGATVRPNDTIIFRSFVSNGQNFTLTPEQNLTSLRVADPANPVSPSASLQPSKTVFGCEDEDMTITAKTVYGSGGRNSSCTWSVDKTDSQQIKSLVQAAKDCVLKIPANALSALRKTNANAMSVSANVCNFVQKCSQTEAVAIGPEIHSGMIFTVKIAGIPSNPVSSIRVTMSAQPSLTQCNSSASLLLTGVSYTWVFNGSVSSSLQYTYTTQDSVVTIPSNFFEAGDVIVVTLQGKYVLEETSKSSFFNATDTQTIKFGTEPIVVVVDATSKTVAADDTLQIDASRSWSPNGATRVLKHNWSCFNMTTMFSNPPTAIATTTPIGTHGNCVWSSPFTANISWQKAVLVIPPNSLVTNGSFLFTDHINDGANESDTVIKLVALSSIVKEDEQPETYVEKEEPKFAIQDVIQTKGGYIRLQAFISSKSGDLSTEWKLFKQSEIDETCFAKRKYNRGFLVVFSVALKENERKARHNCKAEEKMC